MYVVLDENSFFVARLWNPTSADLSRPDVVSAPDLDPIGSMYRLVAGAWEAPASYEPTLAAAKAAKWAEIQAASDAQEFGTFTYASNVYQCNVESRTAIASYANRAQREDPNWNVDWRLANDTYTNLDGGEMIAAHDAMNEHIKVTNATKKARWEAIQASANLAAVAAVTWVA